jgi:hypothetical protein
MTSHAHSSQLPLLEKLHLGRAAVPIRCTLLLPATYGCVGTGAAYSSPLLLLGTIGQPAFPCMLFAGAAAAAGAEESALLTMSTLTEDGVMAVKQTACDRLLNFRVELKVAGKRIADVLNRMHVAQPKSR